MAQTRDQGNLIYIRRDFTDLKAQRERSEWSLTYVEDNSI